MRGGCSGEIPITTGAKPCWRHGYSPLGGGWDPHPSPGKWTRPGWLEEALLDSRD